MSWLMIIILGLSQSGVPEYYAENPEDFFARVEVQNPIDPEDTDLQLAEAAVWQAAREWRLRDSGEDWLWHPQLARVARQFAGHLQKTGKLQHLHTANARLRTPADRITRSIDAVAAVAENLARLPLHELGHRGSFFRDGQGQLVNARGEPLVQKTYATWARQVVQEWLESPEHRKNLNGPYLYMAVGCALEQQNDLPQIVVVQKFLNLQE